MISQPGLDAPRSIGILLVDDLPAVRQGLRLLLQLEPRVVVIGEAGTAAEALALAEVLRPDVVIMDVRMPGINGIEATALLVAILPQCWVIVLTIHGTADVRARAVAAGARAFVEKGRPEELVEAIRQVPDMVQVEQGL